MPMTATLVLASLFALQSPAAPAPAAPAKVVPLTVQVEADPKADATVQAWAKELRTALGERKDEFRLALPAEKPEFLVRIDSIGKGEGGTPILNGALVLGKTTRPFAYSFTDVKTQAQALARNLRKYADQMKTAPAGR
jgi:hypothetical protein